MKSLQNGKIEECSFWVCAPYDRWLYCHFEMCPLLLSQIKEFVFNIVNLKYVISSQMKMTDTLFVMSEGG